MSKGLARFQVGLVTGWLVLCGLGMGALVRYAGTSGDPGVPAVVWPLGGTVALDDRRPTVVLFAHPRCPCTRASMAELERLQARSGDGFGFRALFFEPEGAGPAWRDTVLWRRAESMVGAEVVADAGGLMSAACGAATSGIVGVYAPDGSLLFWGGVTPSRGHEGDSVGLDTVAALVGGAPVGRGEGADDAPGRASVYGCSLLGSCGVRPLRETQP